MTLTDLEFKLLYKFCKCSAILIILALCVTIYHNYVNTYTYNKEYWRFQNNSFKTLLKGSDKDKLYIINYLLEDDGFISEMMIGIYIITYIIAMIHNNTVYVNAPRCMEFLNYKLNYTELYDLLIYNLIFNSMITFPILIISIQLANSVMPYIPVYTLISLTIFLNVTEKIFKIMFIKENKVEWNLFLKKKE